MCLKNLGDNLYKENEMRSLLFIGFAAVVFSGCDTIDNSYDTKCKCTTDSQGTETCKCKDYDRDSIYEDFAGSDVLIYDKGGKVVVEYPDSVTIFEEA